MAQPEDRAPVFTVAQIGAREHYAVPRSFHRLGRLRQLFTEFWWPFDIAQTAKLPRMMRRILGRRHGDLPNRKVAAFNLRQTLLEARLRASSRGGDSNVQFQRYVARGRWFAARVNRALQRSGGLGTDDAFFGFTTGSLETLRYANANGAMTIVDEISPCRTEERLVIAERSKWAGWEPERELVPAAYWQRLEAEWAEAKIVLVNSEFSRASLIDQGAEPSKIIVVPLAYETRSPGTEAAAALVGPGRDRLRVLWLGSVILRKGIPYLIEAARELEEETVDFIIAGPIGISADVVASAPNNMRFIGQVPRLVAADQFRRADLFVLPTISDGFAITQIEAMAHGCPVIATPNCGRVVEPDHSGMIVPVADAGALAEAIRRLNRDRDLLERMKANAIERSRQFSLDRYGRTVIAAVNNYQSGLPLQADCCVAGSGEP